MRGARPIDVESNMGLVFMVANRMRRLVYGIVEFQDLISDGTIGLIFAVERYEARRGISFSTFACSYIHGYILQGNRAVLKELWKARESRFDVPSTTFSIWRKTVDSEDEVGFVKGLDDQGQGAERSIENSHRAVVWAKLLPLLTKRQREIVQMILAGISQKEIAPMLGVSPQAVSQAYQKSIKRARLHLAQEAT